ncbi:MAG: CGGC domain-containing protein [Oscillospiraceae bacterium]|nr:CGGC domain-containing protein [Oscillospiraceae bacterium]
MKIAMLNCLKANDVCTGAGCLRAMNSRTAHFAPYADEPLVLVAMARCSGCDVGIDEGFREKLDRIVSEGAEACHFGVCTVRKDLGKECPVITEAAAYLEQRGVRPVRGTH